MKPAPLKTLTVRTSVRNEMIDVTQRVFERVRRVELALEIPPSHYERGADR